MRNRLQAVLFSGGADPNTRFCRFTRAKAVFLGTASVFFGFRRPRALSGAVSAYFLPAAVFFKKVLTNAAIRGRMHPVDKFFCKGGDYDDER